MSKCRSMYAGSSGSAYGVNENSPGNGNGKWQGLPPVTNMRSNIVPYVKTHARGDNRDVVFCMNQLGGVGRISNMFATTADGVKKPCADGLDQYPYGTLIAASLDILKGYFNNKNGSMILVGKKETLQTDGVIASAATTPIKHYFAGTQEFSELPEHIQYHCTIINDGLKLAAPLKYGGVPRDHVVGWASFVDQAQLMDNGFGFLATFGPKTYVMVFGINECIKTAVKKAFEAAINAVELKIAYEVICVLFPKLGLGVLASGGGPEDPATDAAATAATAGYGPCQFGGVLLSDPGALKVIIPLLLKNLWEDAKKCGKEMLEDIEKWAVTQAKKLSDEAISEGEAYAAHIYDSIADAVASAGKAEEAKAQAELKSIADQLQAKADGEADALINASNALITKETARINKYGTRTASQAKTRVKHMASHAKSLFHKYSHHHHHLF